MHMRLLSWSILILSLAVFAPAAQAETLWGKEFSNVKDWIVIYDPGSDSSIKSVDGLGALYVNAGKNEAAFGPDPHIEANFMPFDPSKASEYTISWKIEKMTGSAGWDIAIDEFNADKQFINTVWNIYPGTGNCSDRGEFSKILAERQWKPETRYIMPKINVHTGAGAQTVYLRYIKIDRTAK